MHVVIGPPRGRVRVAQRRNKGLHGRSHRFGHAMGCGHDRVGPWCGGVPPHKRGTPLVCRQREASMHVVIGPSRAGVTVFGGHTWCVPTLRCVLEV